MSSKRPRHARPEPGDDDRIARLGSFRASLARFMLSYQFGINEIMTKVNILRTEFEHLHDHSPIEHVSSRLKSPESILEKVQRHELPLSIETIQEQIHDIAGIRIVCSFIADVYLIAEMLAAQPDITVIETKDYIEHPKPNGYKSLHLIVQVPVFLSSSVTEARVEIQIRTIAMDFWASLEHKIDYKFDQEIPAELLNELTEAAELANNLDLKMERIHREVRALRPPNPRLRTQTDEVIHPEALLLGALFPNGREPGHGDTTDEPSR
ncbi:GTP pyrophosphokinase family protein [Leucobacter triazinivorans]|uniref:GTP pyrophosphokinase family protein n=2 Tax=Leucobacter triazinivorans TaxID=1784719 RepID=A0A4P6KG06_9MICO|nr:GTP pyrophosphokinase family protein [Leucobacter triazinivorans]QBE50016.1 GTP pyrophosphokinase family protein [Leucobacter triazinivorans]